MKQALRIGYRILAISALIYGLWGIGRAMLAINQPMGGFIWYYDEAVSGGWIVNWDTGEEWPALAAGRLQLGDRILAINGQAPDTFGEVYRATPVGTGITYTVWRAEQVVTIPDVPVVTFTWPMFFQSQAILFLSGAMLWLMGVFVHYAAPASDYSYAFSFFALAISLITLSHAPNVCVNTPLCPQPWMFLTWKPIWGAALISGVYFATGFPLQQPALPPPLSKTRLRRAAWWIGGSMYMLYVCTGLLPTPLGHWDALAYKINLGMFLLSLLVCALLFAHTAWKSASFIARQQARVILLGWSIAAVPILLMWLQVLFPHFSFPSWNIIAFLELALPLSIAYTILRYQLFMVRAAMFQGLLYGLLGAGSLFIYISVSLFLQHIPWFNQLQAAFTQLTYQQFDLRATISTLLAGLCVLRLYGRLQQQWTRERSRLKPRFPAIVAHLCDRLEAQNAYIALRQGEVFVIEAVYNMRYTPQPLSWSEALAAEAHIAFKVPLETDDEPLPLGIIAFGPKRNGKTYTPTERTFVTQTVAALFSAGLWNLHQLTQLEGLAQTSQARVLAARETTQKLQAALTDALTTLPEKFPEWVEQALEALRYTEPESLSALAQSPLSGWALACAHSTTDSLTDVARGRALKTLLLEMIEALQPPPPQDLTCDEWLHYLILKRSFVENVHWKKLHHELLLSQASYYRKRRAAIARLTQNLETQLCPPRQSTSQSESP